MDEGLRSLSSLGKNTTQQKKGEKGNDKRKKSTTRYWKPDQQRWEEYNRRVWEILMEQHQEEWDNIRKRNEAEEPESPFTLAMTQEEESTRELLAKYGHICPRTPDENTRREWADAQLLGSKLADRWEERRTGIHRAENMPMTPDEGDQSQPRTPDTDIYDTAGREENVKPTLAQWEHAIKTAAEETLEKISGEKRKDYISHKTWDDKLSKETHDKSMQDQSEGTKKGSNVIFKPEDRVVHLLGQDHVIKGGHMEFQKSK